LFLAFFLLGFDFCGVEKCFPVSFHISFLSRCENVITDMSQVRLLLLSVAVFLLHQCKKGCLGDIRFFAEECLYHSLQKEWKYWVRVEANLNPI